MKKRRLCSEVKENEGLIQDLLKKNYSIAKNITEKSENKMPDVLPAVLKNGHFL